MEVPHPGHVRILHAPGKIAVLRHELTGEEVALPNMNSPQIHYAPKSGMAWLQDKGVPAIWVNKLLKQSVWEYMKRKLIFTKFQDGAKIQWLSARTASSHSEYVELIDGRPRVKAQVFSVAHAANGSRIFWSLRDVVVCLNVEADGIKSGAVWLKRGWTSIGGLFVALTPPTTNQHRMGLLHFCGIPFLWRTGHACKGVVPMRIERSDQITNCIRSCIEVEPILG